MRRAYQTDLSDTEWACLEPHLLPTPKAPGRPRVHSLREILKRHLLQHTPQRLCLAPFAPRLPPSLLEDHSTITTSELGGSTAPTCERMHAALRERLQRSVHLCGDEPSNDEEISSLMRLFGPPLPRRWINKGKKESRGYDPRLPPGAADLLIPLPLAPFWMPARHMLCVGVQVRPRPEVVVVKLQL